MHQLNINNAFLRGKLEEEVYMKIPTWYGEEIQGKVCRIREKPLWAQASIKAMKHKFERILVQTQFQTVYEGLLCVL